jgi:hypothetical protein
MAWTYPATFASGQILGAADLNLMQDNLVTGVPTFATEVARDTAIVAPTQGQMCNIYSPSSISGTGGGTHTFTKPAVVTYVYTGSYWMVATPISTRSDTTGTLAITGAYVTTMTGDAQPLSITLPGSPTGAGYFLVRMTTKTSHTVAGAATYLGFEMNGYAGVISALDATSSLIGVPGVNYGYHHVVDRLVYQGGSSVTFTMAYKTSVATMSCTERSMTIVGYA